MVSRLAPALLVGLVAFIACRLALLPGLGFWDTAELQTVGPLLGTAHPTGFPTYVLLAWLASVVLQPFGEPAHAMNLFAALCVAVAAAVTVDLVRALTRSVPLAVAAGLGLALTEIVWRMGTRAEAHALHLALLAVLLRLLVVWEDDIRDRHPRADRALVAAAVAYALAVGNHSLTLLLAPGVGSFVLAVDPTILRQPRRIIVPAAAILVTLIVIYAQLPLRAGPFRAPLVYGRPDTWAGFWEIVLAQQFQGSVVGPFSDLGGKLGVLIARVVGWFGPLAALVPVGFVATVMARPRFALLSGISVALTCFFAASYENAEIDRYYLGPVLFAWIWLAMLAAAVLSVLGIRGRPPAGERVLGTRLPGLTERAGPGPLSVVLPIVLAIALGLPQALAAPDTYRRVERTRDRSAPEWVARALRVMEPEAVLVSWWSYSTPLWYAQLIEGQRPDLRIVDDRTRLDQDLGSITDVIDANLPTRPVYVIRADPREIRMLEERYVLDPIDGRDASGLTRVLSLRGAGA